MLSSRTRTLIGTFLQNRNGFQKHQLYLLLSEIRQGFDEHKLPREDIALVKTLIGQFPFQEMNDDLLVILVSRTSNDMDAFELQYDILDDDKSELASQQHIIWQKINALNHISAKKSQTSSAKEKWQKLSNIFVGQDKAGHKRGGLSLKSDYWQEGYSQGIQAKNVWFNVWKSSSSNLPFNDWCTRVGIEDKSVHYYNEEQRQALKVTISDGELCYANADKVDTVSKQGQRYFNCVFSLEEELYISDYMSKANTEGAIHHSSVLGGSPVIYAGEIMAVNGKISEITMRSGHYKPSESSLITFLTALKGQGIELSNIKLYDGLTNLISENADAYLDGKLADKSADKSAVTLEETLEENTNLNAMRR